MTHTEALAATRTFIERLVKVQVAARQRRTGIRPATATHITKIDRLVMFSRSGQSVTLIGQDADTYLQVHRDLYSTLPEKRRMVLGTKTIEVHLQKAVLEALTATDASGEASAVETAMRNLKAGLGAPPTEWTLYFPIEGLAVHRSHSFGGVRFRQTSAFVLKTLRARGRHIILRGSSPSSVKQSFAKHYREHIGDTLAGRTMGVVTITAVDDESAIRLGREHLRMVLDVIGFCDSLVTPGSIIRLPTIDGGEWAAAPVAAINTDQRLTLPSERGGRDTNLTALVRHKHNAGLVRRISIMLVASSPTT